MLMRVLLTAVLLFMACGGCGSSEHQLPTLWCSQGMFAHLTLSWNLHCHLVGISELHGHYAPCVHESRHVCIHAVDLCISGTQLLLVDVVSCSNLAQPKCAT